MFMTNSSKFLSDYFPNIPRRDLAASIVFKIPFLRELCLWLGNIDCSKKYCHKALQNGYSLFVYTGGEYEQLLTDSNSDTIILPHANRKGIIRLALEYGCRIIPIYVFGEEKLYKTSNFLLKWRIKIAKNLRIALPIAFGRFGSFIPLIPYKHKLTAIIGSPIITNESQENRFQEFYNQYQKNNNNTCSANIIMSPIGGSYLKPANNVSEEEVDRVLAIYLKELQSLFNRHKHSVEGYERMNLKII